MKILHSKQSGSGEIRKLGPYQIESLISPAEEGADALVMLDLHCPGSRPDRDVYFTDEAPEGFTDLG